MNAVGGQSCCHKRRQTEDQESKKCRKPVHRPHGGGESDVGAGSPLGSCNETVPSQRVAVISLCVPSFISPRCSLARPQLCLSVRLSVQTRRHVARLSAFTSAVVQVGGRTQLQFCSVSQINPSVHWESCNETTWQLQSWFMLLIYVKWIESVQAFRSVIEVYIFLRLFKPLKKNISKLHFTFINGVVPAVTLTLLFF